MSVVSKAQPLAVCKGKPAVALSSHALLVARLLLATLKPVHNVSHRTLIADHSMTALCFEQVHGCRVSCTPAAGHKRSPWSLTLDVVVGEPLVSGMLAQVRLHSCAASSL
jgi:hypothetical protein